jgi:CelD/BcsL family acetyltransferase involved in cellulose biosynthesis
LTQDRRAALTTSSDTSGARWEIVEEIPHLAREWDELADALDAAPWFRPGWFEAWWTAFGAGRLCILTLRRGEKLVGVFPVRDRLGGVGSLSNWHTPEFGPLAEPGEEIALASGLVGWKSARISLAFVDASRQGTSAFCAAADAAGYRLLTRALERSPYVDLRRQWTEYESERGRKLRSELRRRRRRLDASGRFSFEVHDGRELLDELLDEGFRVEAASWKGSRGSAIASQTATSQFYRATARWAAARGWLRLGFLRLDGRPFAFDFCLEANGIHYLLKTGYDPAYREFGPGVMLRYHMLSRAFSVGLRSYEFLGADEPWKLEWTDTVRERSLVQAFSPSPLGRLNWVVVAQGRPLVKRALALARR